MKLFSKLMKNEKGATAIEYGLIAALISVALVATAGALGGQIGDTFQFANDEMAAGVAAAGN
jgi:pilus assembly protein Flp/PilA